MTPWHLCFVFSLVSQFLPTTFVFPSITYATVLIKLNSPTGISVITLTGGEGSLTRFKKKYETEFVVKKIFKKTKKRPKLKLVEILRSTTIVSGFDNESVDQNGWVEHLVSSNSVCLYGRIRKMSVLSTNIWAILENLRKTLLSPKRHFYENF